MATTRPTTAVSSSSSGKLRSQIGQTKRRISEHLLDKKQYTDTYGNYKDSLTTALEQLEKLRPIYKFGLKQLELLDPTKASLMQAADDFIGDATSTQTPITQPPTNGGQMEMPKSTFNLNQTNQSTNAESDFIINVGSNADPIVPIPSSGHNIVVSHQSRLAVPQMKIPTFSGDISKFLEFRDSFTFTMRLIQVDDLSKLHYLRSSMEGEPEELLRSLPIISSNYEIAMKVLEEQYGGQVRIKHNLLSKLSDLPDLSQDTNSTNFRRFTIQASLYFDQLLNLNCDVDNFSTGHIIQNKLPTRIKRILFGKGEANMPTSTKDLISRLKELSRDENLLTELFKNKGNQHQTSTTMLSQQTTNKHKQQKDHLGHLGQGKQIDSTTFKVTTPCAFCAEEKFIHPHIHCKRYSTVESRTDRARELHLCFRCLRSGHSSQTCQRQCHHCQGNHHQSLCYRFLKRHVQSNGNPPPSTSNPSSSPSWNNASHQQSTNRQQQQQNIAPKAKQYNGNNGQPQQGNQKHNFQQKPYFGHPQQQQQQQRTNLAMATEPGENQTMTVITYVDDTIVKPITTLETVTSMEPLQQSAELKQQSVIMMTAELPVLDKDGNEVKGTVFFDSGSNMSYISTSFAEKLKLDPLLNKQLHIDTFASSESRSINSNVFNVSIRNLKSSIPVKLCEVPYIARNIVSVDVDNSMINQLLNYEHIPLQRQQKEVDILIGLDTYLELLGQVNTVRLFNGLHLNMTDCGPIISGRETINALTLLCKQDIPTDAICQELHNFWKLESIGITDQPNLKIDEEVNEFYTSTTTRDTDGRFILRLPYIDKSNTQLPSNRALAFGRLQGILRKLRSDPELLQKYDNIFAEQLKFGFIELVDENTADGPIVQYLGHHPVFKQDSKSTKIRIVFDGSAKSSKSAHSLNDVLHTGQRLLPDTAALFLRIRQFIILLSADIEKAFLQLSLHLEDRDATRFLWINPATNKVICYRYRRVPFGLKSSPFLLNKSVKTRLESSNNPMAQKMINSFYVDNAFIGVNTFEEAKEVCEFARTLFKTAQMNLCQWFSNNAQFNKYIADSQNTPPEARLQKVLAPTGLLTKRAVLRFIASCYDPIGILTPVTLYGKLFFQKLAHKEMQWDDSLTPDQHKAVQKILQQFEAPPWHVPRRFFQGLLQFPTTVELHVFTDASTIAYGTVAYLRGLDNQQVDTQFLMSKSRVVPLKTNYTIPALEMLAILTGVRLANYCLSNLQLTFGAYIWSDSLCSVDSLSSSHVANSRFARNRMKAIQEEGAAFIYTHVKGKINPADYLTRGLSFTEVEQSELWLKGPSFLRSTAPLPIRCNSTSIMEIPTTSLVIHEDPIIDTHRFSSFHRLLRTMMVIFLFVGRGKMPLQQRVYRSLQFLLHLAQSINPPQDDTIKALRLRRSDKNNLWIFTGRAELRPLVYLPHGHIAQLLVMDIHIRHFHSSPLYTLSQLREQFWIPRGRSFVQKTIKNCTPCRKMEPRPYHQPAFAEFPRSRLEPSKPFTTTGVDYGGPLQVSINGVTQKIWIVLFTCLYSRFTATEIVLDMKSTSFLTALRRFVSIHDKPTTIICDNASQFTIVSSIRNILQNELQQSPSICSTSLPEFHFIPAHSPWAGGVYERMMSLIKKTLVRAGTTKRLLSLEDFRTTLAECTTIINYRPLSYVSSDDDISPIRPVDYVFPHRHRSHPPILSLDSHLDIDLETLSTNTILPTQEGEIKIENENNSVITRVDSSGIVSVQLQLKNYIVERIVQEDQCNISQISMAGCYSCSQGSIVKMTCSSIQSEVEGRILCPSITSSVNCTKQGERNLLVLHVNHQTVNENCSITCGHTTTSFLLIGQLFAVETFKDRNSSHLHPIMNSSPRKREKKKILSTIGSKILMLHVAQLQLLNCDFFQLLNSDSMVQYLLQWFQWIKIRCMVSIASMLNGLVSMGNASRTINYNLHCFTHFTCFIGNVDCVNRESKEKRFVIQQLMFMDDKS
ncbi:Protein CBG26128 [Caenorhabditis briggsae]|uniref:Protein CBG26128 n=1 Tax=Caenorhabditis briggsae TaxID=6238 RepID=B6IFH5_CAEBR|nr:Protein CBG26128 [Caenorhabditis briggsae]CAR98655.1 Protein CBG26128 [Caenorhabditis briggsae]